MEEKVTACSNCPLFEDNPDEGYICNHPAANNIKIKGYGYLPKDCPLRVEPLTISLTLNHNEMETKEFSLQNVISKQIYVEGKSWQPHVYTITEEQKKKFLSIFTSRCTAQTRGALERAINDNFSRVKSAGILERVMFNTRHKPCEYVCGQEYRGEVAYIRNYIKKFY